jgi:hypothetical protein
MNELWLSFLIGGLFSVAIVLFIALVCYIVYTIAGLWVVLIILIFISGGILSVRASNGY